MLRFFGFTQKERDDSDKDVEEYLNCNSSEIKWDIVRKMFRKCRSNDNYSRECIESIMKQISNTDMNIGRKAVELLNDIAKFAFTFHSLLVTDEFESKFRKVMDLVDPEIASEMQRYLKEWVEFISPHDIQYRQVQSFYHRFKLEGYYGDNGCNNQPNSMEEMQPNSRASVEQTITNSDKDVEEYLECNLNYFVKWGLIKKMSKKCRYENYSKDLLESIMKQIANCDMKIGKKTLELLNELIKISDSKFCLQLATDEFEDQFRQVMNKSNPKIASEMRKYLRLWVEQVFTNHSQYHQMKSFYYKLRSEGYYNTRNYSNQPVASHSRNTLHPNVQSSMLHASHNRFVASAPSIQALEQTQHDDDSNEFTISQNERDDIAKAIELSLRESRGATAARPLSTNPSTSNEKTEMSQRRSSDPTTSIPTFELTVDCSICMDFKANVVIVATECGHLYHRTCILEWLQQSNTCPDCRVRISSSLLRKIFVSPTRRNVTNPNAINTSNNFENLTKSMRKEEAGTNSNNLQLPGASGINQAEQQHEINDYYDELSREIRNFI